MTKALAAIALFLAAASSAAALPKARDARFRLVPDVAPRHARNVFGAADAVIAPAPAAFADAEPVNALRIGLDYAQDALQAAGVKAEYVVKNSVVSSFSGVTHVYLKQVINGLEVVNGDASVHVAKDGSVISFSESFFGGEVPEVPTPQTLAKRFVSFVAEEASPAVRPPADALAILANKMGLSSGMFAPLASIETVPLAPEAPTQDTLLRNVPYSADRQAKAKLAWIQTDNGESLVPVWDLVVESKDGDMWLNAQVKATPSSGFSLFADDSSEIVAVHDWVSDASFNVYPIGVNDPSDGNRKIVVDPHLVAGAASPLGWNDQGEDARGAARTFTTTRGNNVNAQENTAGRSTWESNYRPDGGAAKKFDFPVDLTKDPSTYIDAAVTNLFYWNNVMHDVFYQYGFDEVSGNFQENNLGRGGEQADAVIANAQDGSGTNNANFGTPPDGQPGRMRMYVWTNSQPKRDGDFEAGIVIHEYAHGISTRLTGGPANSNCLQSGESGGMGEGWGDTFATMLRTNSTSSPTATYPMGAYSANSGGIRKFPYSTLFTVNPSTYAYINNPGYSGVHAKGEVWAVTLMQAFWNVVAENGFSNDWYKGTKGNNMFLRDVVEGLKLQPCRPSFVDARDAIILADKQNYKGKNVCAIWRGFAVRGLGVKAAAGGIEDFTLPAECM